MVLERVAAGAPLGAILKDIVELIERHAPDALCSILLVDARDQCVRRGAASRLPAEFMARLDGLKIGPTAGSCGAAGHLGERVIVENIATHPNWEGYRHLAAPHGLVACWSSPILSPEREALGTFAIYYKTSRGPRPEELQLVDAATHLAAVAILRDRSQRALEESEHRANDRVKELTVLHQVSRLLQPGDALDQPLLTRLVAVLPAAWQRPDLCVARIEWDGRVASTPKWRPTEWRLAEPFTAANRTGLVEVAYLENVSGAADLFLPEERDVLRSVADMLSTHVRRLEAEGELRRSEERLRAVIENTPDVAIQWYDEEGRLLFVNQASGRILGLSADAIGKTLLELGFWSAAEEARFALMRGVAVAGQPVAPVEFRFRSPAGGEGILLSTVFRIPQPQGGSCTVCMDVDVTERRRLESDLNQAQRLTALGVLAGGIAHDFNNILAAVHANASMALEDHAGPPEARHYMLEIQQAGVRASKLVRQMLAFGRKQEPHRELTVLQPVIEEALGLLQASLPRTITLRRAFGEQIPPVEVDSTQVHQVIMNLVTNASQALAGQKGVIEIGLVRCSVSPETPHATADIPLGEYVVVTVRDDGRGMDDVTARRVFEPFFTTKPPDEGTGLGLSVVHGIMKAHGGAVSVESHLGEGTTFRLYFPTVRKAAKDARPIGVVGARPRVLLVDDDEALIFLVQRVLSRSGCQVTPFSDPNLALTEFRANPRAFDVLITDISMPGMMGPDLVARLRAIRPDLPVVMTSGFVRQEDVEAAERLGNVEVVQKPPSIDGYLGLVAPFSIASARSTEPEPRRAPP